MVIENVANTMHCIHAGNILELKLNFASAGLTTS